MAEHIAQFARLSFNKLQRLLPRRRFRIFAIITIATLVVTGVLVFATPVAAQGEANIVWQWLVEGLVWIMLQLATLFIQITIFFLRLFILIAGYNDYINAPVVLLGWNMVRDLANMFFIVVLMVIAFGTILGIEQYEWRKSLVKLILAAILVNFSNLIVQLMIDVVQVFVVTFLNAVAGAAGGNLIQMFNFDKIFDITVGSEPPTGSLLLNLFGAGVIAVVFAGMAMMTLLAYVVVILGRVVTLWVAIILSPMMFLFSVLPQTKKYADEYWGEVTNNLLSAPVMVFFMWLAFATFGGGEGAVAHIEDDHALKDVGKISNKETNSGDSPSASFNEAADWTNMANFAVAIAFLWLGIDRVQKLGVAGGSMLSGAANFGKKVATIASGYAAGRYLYEKGADLGVKGVKGGFKLATTPVRQRVQAEVNAARANLWSLGRRQDSELGLVGRFAARRVRSYVKRRKLVGKMDNAAKQEEELAFTRNEADASKLLSYQFDERDAEGNVIEGAARVRDRHLEGVMQAEKLRKSAKDKKFQAIGKHTTLTQSRIKGGGVRGDSLAEMIGQMEDHAHATENRSSTALDSASSERARKMSDREKQRAVARATAEDYRKHGMDMQAAAAIRSVEDQIAKEDEALQAVLGYPGRMQSESQLSAELAALQEKKRSGQNLTTKEEEKLKSLIREKSSLTSANNGADRESSDDGNRRALAAIGWMDQKDAQGNIDHDKIKLNQKNRLRAALSRQVGYVVEDSEDAMKEAIAEFSSSFDSEAEQQAAMRRLWDSQKAAAMKGNTSQEGLIQHSRDAEGNTVLTWGEGYHVRPDGTAVPVWDTKETSTSLDDRRAVKLEADDSGYDYYAGRMSLADVDDAQSLLTIGRKTDGGIGAVGVSDAEIDRIKLLFENKDSRALVRNVKASFWKSLKDIEITRENGDQFGELLDAIRSSVKQDDATQNVVNKHLNEIEARVIDALA